jgi:hypothetical protein
MALAGIAAPHAPPARLDQMAEREEALDALPSAARLAIDN